MCLRQVFMVSLKPASLPQSVWDCVTDRARCDALAALDVMNIHNDPDFGRLSRVAAGLFETPAAAIAVVDGERSSLVSAFGIEIRHVHVGDSIAAHAMANGADGLVVLDTMADQRFSASTIVTGAPGIRFYVGAPVTVRGQRIGAMQVFAPEPRSAPDARILAQFLELVATVGRLFELKDEARVRERTAAELIREEWRHALTLEAGKVGSWVWDIQNKTIACNDILRRMYGFPSTGPVTSDDLSAATDPGDRDAVEAALRRTFEEGGDYQAEYRIAATGRWLVARGRVYQRDAAGVPLIMMGVNIDVTEAREAADHTRLLLRELNHRVKNTLAMIQSLARQTMRRSTTPEQFLEAFGGRLQTLSEAHSLLSDRDWTGIGLIELVQTRVAPYVSEPSQLAIAGPDITLPADHALALGLVLHELVVNAARFGSLSSPLGRVSLAWSLTDDERLDLSWIERGGPATGPTERGFGTDLIERGLDKIIGSEVVYTIGPKGAEARITFPLPAN
jgi:PAS domain S-box-containing protein